MKRPLGVALSVVALICVAAVVLVFMGVWSPPWVAKAQSAQPAPDGTIAVAQGKDVTFPAKDGAPEVTIPGSALAGDGKLSVTPADLPEARHGWSIELTGAKLTGQATLVFKNAVTDGTPPPLVGFTEKPTDKPQYVLDTEVSGRDLIVRTTHFSNWFTDSWDWLKNWANGQLDRIYKDSGTGEQPKCDRQAEARAGNVSVTSDSGGRVRWCLGKAPDGSTVLKVNNSRGYAVSAEHTPGLTMGTRSLDFGQMVPRLAKYITAPIKRGDVIDIIGPGETVEYKVSTSGSTAVRLDPSPPAYLATALWFGIETTGMVYGKIFGKISGDTIGKAVDAANCVAGFQGMATADVRDARAAARYLNDATGTVMSCMGKVFERLAKGKVLDMFAVSIAQVFSWLWSGIQTAANGFAAAADAALNFNGYSIAIVYPKPEPTFPTPSTKNTTTFEVVAESAHLTFEYPTSWRISGPPAQTKVLNASGAEVATMDVLTVWDANAALAARPVQSFPSTPGLSPLSKSGKFVVRNVAIDMSPYPQDLSALGWPKPVHLVMSLSDPANANAKSLVPFLMYGLGFVETNVPKFGQTDRLILFQSSKYFDTMEQAKAYTQTEEYRQIQTMIASFKG